MPATLLFVYGTLLQSDNEFAHYLRQHSSFYANGKINGRLFDIGEYPGLIIDDRGYYVFGRLYRLHNECVLKELDAYEGVGPYEDQPNLYKRVKLPIVTARGAIKSWVFIYNLSIDGLIELKSGDYIEYIAQKKSPDS